jgi:hypothetical protein
MTGRGTRQRGSGPRARLAPKLFVVLAAGLISAALLVATASASDPSMTISGEAREGQTLTANPAGLNLYKWQRCNPAVATCADTEKQGQEGWTDIVTGPDHTYTLTSADVSHKVRVLAKETSLGSQFDRRSSPLGPVVGSAASGPAPTGQEPPVLRVSGNLENVGGAVSVLEPGSKQFVDVETIEHILMGSIVDARQGVSRLYTAKNASGDIQSGRFRAGMYKITQGHGNAPFTILTLVGDVATATATASWLRSGTIRAHASGRVGRRLWGRASGRYRTRGRYSSATIRGTYWLVEEVLRGTRTRVRRGRVRVRDRVRHRTVLLKRGQTYLARRPRR